MKLSHYMQLDAHTVLRAQPCYNRASGVFGGKKEDFLDFSATSQER